MTPNQFLDSVASLKLAGTFNPYRDRCDVFDIAAAPSIRLENLKRVLFAALDKKVETIWIARDLGYRGGRRTGLALTDELRLSSHARLYGDVLLNRSTRGPEIAERTAAIIWNMLEKLSHPVFLWNIVPVHPYEGSDPHTNRCHTKSEAKACEHLLIWLLDTLKPTTVVAIGLEAQSSLDQMCIKHIKARHPSYGGKKDFEMTISQTFALEREEPDEMDAFLPF